MSSAEEGSLAAILFPPLFQELNAAHRVLDMPEQAMLSDLRNGRWNREISLETIARV
jgi:hypothetical protein